MPVGKDKGPIHPVSLEVKEPDKCKVKGRVNAVRSARFRSGMRPGPPYKCMVRVDTTDRFIKDPENWESVINRKTYNRLTGELIEDLDLYPKVYYGDSKEKKDEYDVHPTVPDEVLTRKLPNGATQIKTVLEYGVLTYPKRSNKRK